MIETLFLNMFFGGILKAMPPKLLSDDGKHVVIRPMAACAERELASYARHMQFPIIPCDLCGSQPNLQRQKVKEMLATWEKDYPGRVQSIARALTNVVPTHLADRDLFDFAGLGAASKDPGEPLPLLTGFLHALGAATQADEVGEDSASASAPLQFFARRPMDIEG
jgi:tRNA 2-thiocytidine biosynthesis protein TtcA